jgi:hypothetical protein
LRCRGLTNSDSYCYGNSNCHADSRNNAHGYANSDTYTDVNANADSCNNAHGYTDSDTYTDSNSNSDRNPHGDGNINPMYGEMFTDAEASAYSEAAPIARRLRALCVHAVAAGMPSVSCRSRHGCLARKRPAII